MDFWVELIIISVVGAIVAIDTTASWQAMISQPLVSCTALGWMFGNTELGLTMGILMELPWLMEIPAGGSHVSEGNVGSLVSTGVALHLVERQVNTENIIIIFSIIAGLAVSWIGGNLVDAMRRSNVLFAYRADKAADRADFRKITILNIGGVGHAFSLGFILVAFFFSINVYLLSKLVSFIPPFFNRAFGFGKIGMLALGVSSMVGMFLTRENLRYLFIGALIALIGCFIF